MSQIHELGQLLLRQALGPAPREPPLGVAYFAEPTLRPAAIISTSRATKTALSLAGRPGELAAADLNQKCATGKG